MNDLQIRSIECSCGNDTWDIYGDVLKCSFCLDERPYIRRKPKENHITPSQQKRIYEIKAYFLNTFAGEKYGIDLEIEHITNGKVLIKIETGGNFLVAEGATICIGIRGGLNIWTTSYGTHEGLLKQRLGIR